MNKWWRHDNLRLFKDFVFIQIVFIQIIVKRGEHNNIRPQRMVNEGLKRVIMPEMIPRMTSVMALYFVSKNDCSKASNNESNRK